MIPSLIPFALSRLLVERDNGSSVEDEMSPTKIRVGSDLHPAPIDDMTGILLVAQYARRSTFETMASTTNSAPANNLSASDPANSSFLQSKLTHGAMACNLLFKQCTFGVPTSASVATACLFKLLNDTWSKSINRMCAAPERARAAAQCDPTPPQPTMTIFAFLSLESPASPRNTRLRASCSRMSSVGLRQLVWFGMSGKWLGTFVVVAF